MTFIVYWWNTCFLPCITTGRTMPLTDSSISERTLAFSILFLLKKSIFLSCSVPIAACISVIRKLKPRFLLSKATKDYCFFFFFVSSAVFLYFFAKKKRKIIILVFLVVYNNKTLGFN